MGSNWFAVMDLQNVCLFPQFVFAFHDGERTLQRAQERASSSTHCTDSTCFRSPTHELAPQSFKKLQGCAMPGWPRWHSFTLISRTPQSRTLVLRSCLLSSSAINLINVPTFSVACFRIIVPAPNSLVMTRRWNAYGITGHACAPRKWPNTYHPRCPRRVSLESRHTLSSRICPGTGRVADQIRLSQLTCMRHEPSRGGYQNQSSTFGIPLCIPARRERTTGRHQQPYHLFHEHRYKHAQVEARGKGARDQ